MKELQKPLSIEEIDFRVQSINKWWYATILAYKDARVDMKRLDDVFWVFWWKKEYTRDNKNCIVSIWDKEKEQRIGKEDTGTESNTEQAKWLASDSFKRACFNRWIGRELYDYPIINIKLIKDVEWNIINSKPKATYNLKLKQRKRFSQFKEWKLIYLACKDENWKKRFEFWEYEKKIFNVLE